MKTVLSLVVCVLLPLAYVVGEEAPSSSSSSSSTAEQQLESSPEDLSSRAKRAVDMRRLARGFQMLRLGKRALPVLRLGKRDDTDQDQLEQLLLDALENQYYDDEEEGYLPYWAEEPYHPRYRRSAETPDHQEADTNEESSNDVKRSVGSYLDDGEDEVGFGDGEGFLGAGERGVVDKRPMSMLRLGKRPVGMLRLGKRPMSMLRLGKREDDEVVDSEAFFAPSDDLEGDELSADKRPVSMLRLGKRPMSMLRLGKRPVSMLRLGKRPVGMLRLGKRPMSMLRLGKRPVSMLRLGKRPMSMLRLGKRPMSMLRLGKRPMSMLRLGKRPMSMLRLGKRQVPMLRLGKRASE